MAHVVKDLKYLPAGVAPGGAVSSLSDTGQGGYPNLQYQRDGVLYTADGDTQVIIPWSQVVEITETTVP